MYGFTKSISEMEEALVAREAQIAELRCEQVVLVNELRRARAVDVDGSRSMVDWVQAHLDVRRTVASDLVLAARRFPHHRYINHFLSDGSHTFDRTIASLKLADAGASRDEVDRSLGCDLAGVKRSTAKLRRMTRRDEREVHAERYVTVRTSLDESSFRIAAHLPGVDGRVVEKALAQRADELRQVAGELPSARGQLMADALTSIAQDSLDRDVVDVSSSGPHVTVFVDARQDDPSETAAEVEFGPRVGPATLEEIVCSGSVRVVGFDDGVPVVTSRSSRAIPLAIRDAVAHRDGGCTIDGCMSRYRLEPHHIRPWSEGGDHAIDNLTTLCWYHHHVAIHGDGYEIDPLSPPRRRTLSRPSAESRAGPY